MTIHPSPRRAGFSGVQLLVVLALGLCGLVVWQWTRETSLYGENVRLKSTIASLAESTNSLQQHIATVHREIAGVEEFRKSLQDQIRSNKLDLTRLTRELAAAQTDRDRATNSLAAFKDSYDQLREKFTQQNEAVKKQNENVVALKKMADERNELATRINEQTRQITSLNAEYNKLVEEYNKLAKQAGAASK